jgi:glycosyltransferase involved in cell wall biosynthesis
MKVVISHPTGNEFVRAAAVGLNDAGNLSKFETAIAVFQGDFLYNISKFKPLSELRRRKFNSELKPVTETWPWYELGRLGAAKLGLKSLTRHEAGIFCIDSVYQSFDKHVASSLKYNKDQDVNAVYAYEDGAASTFAEAKRLGIKCLYDLPIGYWKASKLILEKEQERWPDWASTLTGLQNSDEKLARKDEELKLADRIFVASSFTASTLKEYHGKLAPVEVIPYGFPPVKKTRTYSNIAGRPLKLLFVGRLSQRKGIADLFEAVKNIGPAVELTIVGIKTSNDFPALDIALKKHRWIPTLPHAGILELMSEHDVLVFPSLFEGFGLVITEAMSQGTPVITTDRTAGPDLIKHGENGWLFNAGSTEALQQAIEEILMKPASVAEVGRLAMESARKRPWEMYSKDLVQAILKS